MPHNQSGMKTILKTITPFNSFSMLLSELIFFLKFAYLIAVLVLSIVAIIEIKNIFSIDIFPGLDTPFDNAYFDMKSSL